MMTQERIDALNARLTPQDIAAIESDWRAVGDDLRAAMQQIEADMTLAQRHRLRRLRARDALLNRYRKRRRA